MAPLVVIGLKAERRLLRIPLFIDYRERNDVPVTAFQATLQVVPLDYRNDFSQGCLQCQVANRWAFPGVLRMDVMRRRSREGHLCHECTVRASHWHCA